MTDTWRLLRHFDAEPGFNMAVDEALLECGDSPPTLRFYTWKPEALSLGYFQSWTEVPAAEQAAVVVRRLTGGGAIHHSAELTFSLVAPEHHRLYRGPVRESYRRIHEAIAEVLAEWGVRAGLRGKRALASDATGTGMCFHKSTDLDLVWDGAKGLGSAQRRKAGRVLHHGSIKLGASALEPGIATLGAHTDGLEARELAEHLTDAFPRLLGMRLDEGQLTTAEEERARSRANHFRSPEFLRRR